jgi:hypothetical protein
MLMAGPRGSQDKTRYWAVLWLAPVMEAGLRDEPYRFEIEIRGKSGPPRMVRSQPFHPASRGPIQSDPPQPRLDSCIKDMSAFQR